jgi:hypothetical protein
MWKIFKMLISSNLEMPARYGSSLVLNPDIFQRFTQKISDTAKKWPTCPPKYILKI